MIKTDGLLSSLNNVSTTNTNDVLISQFDGSKQLQFWKEYQVLLLLNFY